MKEYKKSKGVSRLFTEIITVDWYDGTTTGVCKLIHSNEWYICNMCYFDPDGDLRIFSLVQATDEWMKDFKAITLSMQEGATVAYGKREELIKKAFENYKGAAFLMKAQDVGDLDYDVVQLPVEDLRYVEGVEKAVNQNQKWKMKWLNYFKGINRHPFLD